jgi:hypothetical protein
LPAISDGTTISAMPQSSMPCWQPFVFGYLSVTGWLRWSRYSTRRHRAATCAWSRTGASTEPLPTHQVSARFRPHRWPDSSLSARSTPFHFNFAGCISVPLRFVGRKLPRPAKTAVRPKIPEAAMLRISAK